MLVYCFFFLCGIMHSWFPLKVSICYKVIQKEKKKKRKRKKEKEKAS